MAACNGLAMGNQYAEVSSPLKSKNRKTPQEKISRCHFTWRGSAQSINRPKKN